MQLKAIINKKEGNPHGLLYMYLMNRKRMNFISNIGLFIKYIYIISYIFSKVKVFLQYFSKILFIFHLIKQKEGKAPSPCLGQYVPKFGW